ncbi:MAG: PepSY-associated TM helix domain-containing protein [Candidatus Omnitrophota bacterium]
MKLRTVLFWAHLSIGVCVGLVVLNMAVTGMIMAFEPQIVGFAERKQRFVNVPEGGAQRLSLEVITAKVAAQYPGKKITQIGLTADKSSSVSVHFGREGVVYVHPYTGEILGEESQVHKILHKIEDWHRWFGSKEIGRPITGAACFGFLLLVLSGVYLWWPRQWQWKAIQPILRFNPRLKGKARDWNWHNTIGFWCAPVLIVTTVTGLIMSYTWANNLLYRATGNEPPPPRTQRVERDGGKNREAGKKEERPKAGFDVLYHAANTHVPAWTTMSIRRGNDDAPVVVYLLEPPAWLSSHRSQLTLDPYTADVKKWEPYSAQNSGRKLRGWVKYVHTGQAFGLLGQMVMFTGACGAAVLVWTGFAMAWRRFFVKNKT